MNRIVPAISLVCFLFGGPCLAWAGGGAVAADRLRDPNGRGIAMDVKQYNQDMKKKRSQKMMGAPGQSTTH